MKHILHIYVHSLSISISIYMCIYIYVCVCWTNLTSRVPFHVQLLNNQLQLASQQLLLAEHSLVMVPWPYHLCWVIVSSLFPKSLDPGEKYGITQCGITIFSSNSIFKT
jgi:hypothetical protein